MNIVGIIMLACPFVAIFIWATVVHSFWEAAMIYGVVAILLVWIGVGVHLIDP